MKNICKCGHNKAKHSFVCTERVCKCGGFEEATANSERRVTWQHEETGMTFTKYIPSLEPLPTFPRRYVIRISKISQAQYELDRKYGIEPA